MRCHKPQHRNLTSSKPSKPPNRSLPLDYKQNLREKIEAFFDRKRALPCQILYSAPTMLVPHQNGKMRRVKDYHQLNQQTIKSCCPIPSIGEIFDTLERFAFFSTNDIKWLFQQLQTDEKSQDFTALSQRFASYKWLQIPMGPT